MSPSSSATEALRGAAALAEGRARAYALLAELCARGVQPGTREAARASPLVAAALASYPDEQPDLVAADHHHAFGWAVLGYEGVYLDREGTLGGPSAERIRAAYAARGFVPDPAGEEPEHLVTELRALAFLCGAEADAHQDGLAQVAARMRGLARQLLDEHLLRWLPLWAGAVRRLELAFPTALADQLEDLVLPHRESLGAPWPEAFSLPSASLDLDDAETGLGEIAATLATPASSGLCLSREDLTRLGRGARVPRGFGDRGLILEQLLRTAARYEALPAVIDGLDAFAARWEDELCPTGRYRDRTWLAPLLLPWRDRVAGTRRLLARLRAAAVAGALVPREDGGSER